MKIKSFNPKLLLSLLIAGMMLFSCSKDNEQDIIIGTWTASTATFDAMIGSQTLTEYFMTELDLTAEEAALYTAMVNQALEDGFTGTITVKADNTYVSNLGGSSDTGTWSLSGDRKKLTIDSSSDGPVTYDVLELTASKLHLQISDSVSEDLNGDSTPEDISITADVTFTK